MSPLSDSPAAPATSYLGGGALEFIFILIVFFCILLAAYAVTRLVGRRAGGRMKSRLIEVVDTLGIGADAQLLVVKVGDELFLASKSQKNVALLTKLELTPGAAGAFADRAPGFAGGFRAVLEGKLSRARPLGEKPAAPGGDSGSNPE